MIKMPNILISQKANIDTYPELDIKHPGAEGTEFTIGDLHGNALKFLYFLVRHGILSISREQYKTLVKIYHTPVDDLDHNQLQQFKTILNQAKVNNKGKIRLIGDEHADRGMNDYFTLKIIEKLENA